MPFNLLVCTISFFITLPATIAIFPQFSEIQTSELEPEIQEKAKGTTSVYFNKGL